jgi:hypothetical protein
MDDLIKSVSEFLSNHPRERMPVIVANQIAFGLLTKDKNFLPAIFSVCDLIGSCVETNAFNGRYHVLDAHTQEVPTSPIATTVWLLRRASFVYWESGDIDLAARVAVEELIAFPKQTFVDCIAIVMLGGIRVENPVAFGGADRIPIYALMSLEHFRQDTFWSWHADFMFSRFSGHLGLFPPSAVLTKQVRVGTSFSQELPANSDSVMPRHTYRSELESMVNVSCLIRYPPAYPIYYWMAPPHNAPIQAGYFDAFITPRLAPTLWTQNEIQKWANAVSTIEHVENRERFEVCLRRLHSAQTSVNDPEWLSDAAIDARVAYEVMYKSEEAGGGYRCALRAAHFLGKEYAERLDILRSGASAYGKCSAEIHSTRSSSKLHDATIQLIAQTQMGLSKTLQTLKFPHGHVELLPDPQPAQVRGEPAA